MTPRIALGVALFAAAAAAACARGDASAARTTVDSAGGAVTLAPPPAATPIAPDPAEDGQWPMAAKDYANTRYSGLAEITPENAKNLRLAWTFSTGNRQGHEGAPLVVGSTMYVVTPFPNHLYALDLANSGAVKWAYKPPYLNAAKGVACCDWVNRGAAFYDGRIYYATLDDQVIAVDAASGKEAWRVRVGDISRGETMTMAPLVVKGKVIVGNSGGEFGVRGWIMALDAATGRVAWKAYGTGPDEDVLIGPGFRAPYPHDRGTDLGVKSWPPSMYQTGGATAWGWVSYDPGLDLIYYGTGNAGPWNPELRPGDNKWSATIFARDPDDGQAKWAYQFDPHNDQDYDAINESILLDVSVGGRTRQALVRAERNGYVYLMDRGTGEVISADTFTYVTTVRSVDPKTGLPDKVKEKSIKTGEVTRMICPAVQGSKNYSPAAYSPRTRLVYFPSNNLCMDVIGQDANYISGTPYLGTTQIAYAAPGHTRGTFFAWDPERRRKTWAIPEHFPVWGGALATAGDVVFYGTMDRWFKAVDGRTGKELWKFRTGSSVISQPISFRGPDGHQYVAVYDGVGGWAGTVVSLRLSPDDSTAGDGMVGAMTDLPRYTDKGGTLYVFRLP